MATATARGTSDACIVAWPSPLRAAVLSKRCDPGHRTKLSIESRGGATAGARLNRRSAPFGCSADNRQTTQTIPVAALASDTSPGLGNVPECRFHGLVMPGTGSVRMASRALRRSAAAILRWPCSRRIAMAMLRRLARRSELVIGFDNPHDRRVPCAVYIWSTSARPTHPTSPTSQARTTPRPCRGPVRTELHSRSGGSTVGEGRMVSGSLTLHGRVALGNARPIAGREQ
jgi:hypothetical protein